MEYVFHDIDDILTVTQKYVHAVGARQPELMEAVNRQTADALVAFLESARTGSDDTRAQLIKGFAPFNYRQVWEGSPHTYRVNDIREAIHAHFSDKHQRLAFLWEHNLDEKEYNDWQAAGKQLMAWQKAASEGFPGSSKSYPSFAETLALLSQETGPTTGSIVTDRSTG